MLNKFTEFEVEEATPSWFWELDYTIAYGQNLGSGKLMEDSVFSIFEHTVEYDKK